MKKRFNPGSLLLSIHPAQGLLESFLIGLLILAITSRLEGTNEPVVAQAAVFFLCGVCGMWAVLRIRLPRIHWFAQTVWELGVSAALSLIMLLVLRPVAALLHWDAVWQMLSWTEGSTLLILGCTGIGYFFTRGFIRLWLHWDNLRKKRMLWSITHAHLTVAFIFAFLFALLLFFIAPYSSSTRNIWQQTQDPFLSMMTGVMVTFFPALTFSVLGLAVVICVILPPSAVFSYFVARRITRRLESLAATTAALRAGDYEARVDVQGEDEIAHLQSDFNAMADKLSSTMNDLKNERNVVAQILQSRRDLVANVSHELRTPVATLRAAIETLLERWEETPADENRRKITLLQSEIRQLSGLIDDLFTLAQAEVDHLSLECGPTDLHPLVEQVVDTFSPLAWQSGRVEITAQLPRDLPPVQVDPRRLQQVLLNLLRNGVRHTSPGGIVAILAEAGANTVQIDVKDTGEGIDPADLEHVWERFYRGRNASSESVGLGLSLVKELVESMGGSVSVESEPGKGSCFSLKLPVSQ